MFPSIRSKTQYSPIAIIVLTSMCGCAADGDPIVVGGETLTAASELEPLEHQEPAEAGSARPPSPPRPHSRDTRRGREPSDDDGPTSECPAACTPHVCTPVKPTNALITDFTRVSPTGMFVDTDDYRLRHANWYEEFFGGPYVYPTVDPCSEAAAPAYPLKQSIGRDWHIQGVVGAWSGFGLWFAPCSVDLSGFRGVALSIWGNVGASGHLKLEALTHEDSKPSPCLTNVGSCDPLLYSCKSPSTRIAVPTSKGETITVLFSQFAGGSPQDLLDASQVLGLHLAFERVEWGGEVTAPYPVDVHVDAISLVP